MAQLDKALAQFFAACWDSYTESPTEEMQFLIEDTPLIERKEATEEDVAAGDLPEGHGLGDTYYVLSELGQAAWELAHKDAE